MKDLIPVRAEGSHFLECKCYGSGSDSDSDSDNNELLIPYPSHIPL